MPRTSPIPKPLTRSLAALAALAAAAILAGGSSPAGAQSAAKPAAGCAGNAFVDSRGDGVGQIEATANLDILSGFFLYDAAKGDKGTTANIVIDNLDETVPPGATGIVWSMVWEYGGTNRFVRALIDFSGGPYYEYGTYLDPGPSVENPLPLGRFSREGNTEGAMIPGKDGVVSLVVPAAVGGKPGEQLTKPYAQASESVQLLPGSVAAPTRGLSTAQDSAPNEAPERTGTAFQVAPCPAETAPGVSPTTNVSAPTSSAALPVKVLTKRKKGVKKGKTLPVKLRASEQVTKLVAQLRKGKSVYGKGKLARLSGNGTLKVKISKKLKKGSYTLDLAGSDASGAHRLTAAKITIR
jgi:hypothetical protein